MQCSLASAPCYQAMPQSLQQQLHPSTHSPVPTRLLPVPAVPAAPAVSLPQKAAGIIGKLAESEAQRTLRLYDALQDFGEQDLVMQ